MSLKNSSAKIRIPKLFKDKLKNKRINKIYKSFEKSLKIDENFIVAGKNPETNLVEIVENKDHPWFVGVQFHPEYKSSVYNPHPIFVNFVKASLKNYLKK